MNAGGRRPGTMVAAIDDTREAGAGRGGLLY